MEEIEETWDRSLGWEDPLVEGMQPTPIFLPGESPWTEKTVGYGLWDGKEWDTTEVI